MSEQELQDAFEQMGPSDAARQRMFENILAAHEAASDEQAQPGEQPIISLVAETEAPASTNSKKSSRRRNREFSLLRYVLPLAACLAVAALIPPTLPQLVDVYNEVTSTSSPSVSSSTSLQQAPDEQQTTQQPGDPQLNSPQPEATASGNTSVEVAPLYPAEEPLDETAEQAPVIMEEPAAETAIEVLNPSASAPSVTYVNAPSAPLYMVEDPWPTTVDYVALALSFLVCLVALFIAIQGILAWRRSRKK